MKNSQLKNHLKNMDDHSKENLYSFILNEIKIQPQENVTILRGDHKVL